ncbi:hypothetical protein ES702_05663 [subsurface metagenome]
MDREDLLLHVEVMVDHVESHHFPRIGGRSAFLKEAGNVKQFVRTHRVEADLIAAMFKEIKSKFDILVERTQKDETKA